MSSVFLVVINFFQIINNHIICGKIKSYPIISCNYQDLMFFSTILSTTIFELINNFRVLFTLFPKNNVDKITHNIFIQILKYKSFPQIG